MLLVELKIIMSTLNNYGIKLSITTPCHRIGAVGVGVALSPPPWGARWVDPPRRRRVGSSRRKRGGRRRHLVVVIHLHHLLLLADRPTACFRETTLLPPS